MTSWQLVALVATAVAFVVWFAGLARLPAGTVGLVGLLNPVTGVLLGVLVAGERLVVGQFVGLALIAVGILLGRPAAVGLIRRTRNRGPGATPREAPVKALTPAVGGG
jgi:probable blue pigment (indigoidine) exporter